MSILRYLLLTSFLYAHGSYALLPSHCGVVTITNNSKHSLQVSGLYPDSKETIKKMVIEPYTSQQSISMGTLRTCGGNTKKIHCNAMWIACHKTIKLTINTSDLGTTSFSGLLQTNDWLSFNDDVILINDIPITNKL